MRCPICDRRKGKRRCQINAGNSICSQCCGSVRHDGCGGCSHYESSQRHQRARQITNKKFITEIIPDVDDRCDEALALLEKGKITKGQRIFEDLVRERPNYHMVLYGLGVCCGLQEKPEEAISYFQRAIDVYPIFTEAYMNLGVACCQNIDLPNAVRAFETVIELDGRDGEFGSQAAQRIADFEKMTRENNGISLSAYLRNHEVYGTAFAALKSQEYTKAIRLFELVLSVDPKNVQSHGNIALAYAGLGDKEKALEYFDKAIALDPTYEPAICNRMIVERMEDGEEYRPGIKEIDYYRDYRGKGKRPYVQEVLEETQEQVAVQVRA